MDKLESLLESYYGMQDEETASSNAVDINVAAFDCSAFVSEQLRTKALPELMAQQQVFVGEIRGLDRDMQDLVYNNYNKFISATDTIRRMKDSVGEMESAMQRLVTDMRAMGGSSALVNEHLHENRSKIEKLVGVKRLLLKLEFLFELPMRLRRSMELDALAQAVRYYTMVSEVLHKYDRIGSIHAIRVEADAIMERLKEQLRGVLRSRRDGIGASTASSGKVVEAIRLLVQLDEPRAGLRAAYLTFQRGRLLASLGGFAERHAPPGGFPGVSSASTAASSSAASAAASAAAASSSSSGEIVAAPISDRARAFYAQASAAKAALAAPPSTIAPSRPRATVGAHTFMQGANRAFLDGFRYGAELYVELFEDSLLNTGDASSPAAPPSAAIEAEVRLVREELLAFTKDVFGEYFAAVKRQLSLPPMLDVVATSLAPGEDDEGDGSAAARRRGARRRGAGSGSGDASAASAAASPGLRVEEADEDEVEAEQLKAAGMAAAGYVAEKDQSAAGRYAQITSGLNLLLQDVRGAAKHVREARLVDRAQEVTEAILRAQLDGLFADVRGHVVRLLVTLQARACSIYDAARQARSAGVGVVGGVAQSDWVVAVGAALAAAAEEASGSVSERIDEALLEAKPLVLSGMQLLPDLARTFKSLVHGQVLSVLGWLAAAFEACGDGAHAVRAEFNSIVVEADLGLDRELEAVTLQAKKKTMAGVGASGGGGGGGAGSSRAGGKLAVLRRATVNFGHAEADQHAPVAASAAASSAILNPESDRHHSFLLLLAVLCRHFAHNGVARALSTMITTEPSRTELQAMGVHVGDEDQADSYGSMMDVPDLIRRVQGAGRELLRRFVFLHATRLSGVVRSAMMSGDWLAHREPREARLVVQLVLEDVAAQKKLVAATLGEWNGSSSAALAASLGIGAPRPGATGTSSAGAGSGGGSAVSPVSVAAAASAKRTCLIVGASGGLGGGGAVGGGLGVGGGGGGAASVSTLGLGMGMGGALGLGGPGPGGRAGRGGGGLGGDFVFGSGARHSTVLGAADFSSEAVAKLLLRVVLRALVEWTRTCTFGKGGYQQIQVDVATMHAALPYFAAPAAATGAAGASAGAADSYAGAGALEELLHEVALSAAERCVDDAAASLEPAVLYSIVTARLATLALVGASPT